MQKKRDTFYFLEGEERIFFVIISMFKTPFNDVLYAVCKFFIQKASNPANISYLVSTNLHRFAEENCLQLQFQMTNN